MKFAAYTEETIWAVADDEATARSDGEENMAENGVTDTSELKVAPIDDNLVEVLTKAEETGEDVLFDLIDGELCEVETVEG
ncbi:MAG: hypothetical protein JSR99_08665 [Proteobacteria bacterium]|nr:hypothetical protein [Pseudomonadota bacterium]